MEPPNAQREKCHRDEGGGRGGLYGEWQLSGQAVHSRSRPMATNRWQNRMLGLSGVQ